MKIVSDIDIPFLEEAVRREWPEVDIYPMKSEEITSSAIQDADILIVRTRTLINESLLSGSRVQLVCTATIGFDHIDTAYCESHHIQWMSCPGCNAQAVCDYIEEAIEEVQRDKVQPIKATTIGVVGVGHVGSLVAQMAERRGMKVLLNDPPKGIGVSLGFIAKNCDIITFHTPLTKEGPFPSYHLCDEAFLSQCKPGALIINAARGGIVDEQALLAGKHPFILDTWENEPQIHPAVLDKALLASMHIAGYSVLGKRNASQMCLNAIAEDFHLPKIDISEYSYATISTKKGDSAPGWLSRISDSLKKNPTTFESLRKAYPLRGE